NLLDYVHPDLPIADHQRFCVVDAHENVLQADIRRSLCIMMAGEAMFLKNRSNLLDGIFGGLLSGRTITTKKQHYPHMSECNHDLKDRSFSKKSKYKGVVGRRLRPSHPVGTFFFHFLPLF